MLIFIFINNEKKKNEIALYENIHKASLLMNKQKSYINMKSRYNPIG